MKGDTEFGISVITVTLNERSKLRSTIESVRSFKELNCEIPVEHLIVDGGSSDGTIELLRDQGSQFFRFISEKDEGIYHAMNKGAMMAKLDYVVYINSGDTLNNITLSYELLQQLKEALTRQQVAGFAFSAIYKLGNISRKVVSRSVDHKAPVMPGLHQGMLYKRSSLIDMPYDQTFRICGDYEQFARMYSESYVFFPVDQVLSTLYAGGVSTDNPFRLYSESTSITKKYFTLSPLQQLIAKLKLMSALLYVRLLLSYSKIYYKLNPTKRFRSHLMLNIISFSTSIYNLDIC